MFLSKLGAVDLMTFLNSPFVIIGLIVAVVGFGMAILSKRITRAVRGQDEVANDDKVFRFFGIVGIILIMAGFILIALFGFEMI